MKFGLKTYLISLCVLGATAGILGKLFVEAPETFLSVVALASTVLPFLLATGTIIVLGLRHERRPRLVMWGLFLLLCPLAVRFALSLLWPTGDPLRFLSTNRLITKRLPDQTNEPWIWNELKRRLDSGSLTGEEVGESIKTLVAYMKKSRPTGWDQPLPWQDQFLKAAVSAKLVSDQELLDLCDAFYGTRPTINSLAPTTPGKRNIWLTIRYGNPFSQGSGIGVDLFWDVTQVSVDGTPVKPTSVNRFAQQWSGNCLVDLAPGDHEVQVDLVCEYADSGKIIGGDASAVPVALWPKARKKWTTTVTAPLKVAPAGK